MVGRAVLAALGAIPALSSFPSSAVAQVEYVRICDSGVPPGYFYIPGYDDCFNPVTLDIIVNGDPPEFPDPTFRERLNLLDQRIGFAQTGVAIGLALPNPIMPEGHTFALTGNWGQFQGHHALGLAGALSITPHLMITGGVAVGVGDQLIGTRAGWNLSFGGR